MCYNVYKLYISFELLTCACVCVSHLLISVVQIRSGNWYSRKSLIETTIYYSLFLSHSYTYTIHMFVYLKWPIKNSFTNLLKIKKDKERKDWSEVIQNTEQIRNTKTRYKYILLGQPKISDLWCKNEIFKYRCFDCYILIGDNICCEILNVI